MKILILKKEKTLFDIEGDAVFLASEKGKFEILNNHCSIISMISSGIIKIYSSFFIKKKIYHNNDINISYNDNTTIIKLKINYGFLNFKKNILTIIYSFY
ncbi:MAG: ATP synthase F1 subunit epsilon [Candidatus Sulcia muelleri]|uniref:Putative ATP synthase F1, epsilon subunit n=1 Tax=Karelsulcia muelleri (strain GWSS) TaxID=444179 RepID=A8Z6C6_KARMG|nr:putative ATP synthase F1, epsilon subunit [Candidatus Karelsulcia muelleri GWSS]MBS0018832.1 ATP synthase F1 subunit epsilon [Candidatus Karelsulcia muelleri]MCJ7422593.1 ATP synthase F1 subunit epsilon [Candidatus Karelsulcia muelleri]MCJ7468707.1 ATP synthase F1 subunit epsilon [Candidatus Karelsulcia muelleri]